MMCRVCEPRPSVPSHSVELHRKVHSVLLRPRWHVSSTSRPRHIPTGRWLLSNRRPKRNSKSSLQWKSRSQRAGENKPQLCWSLVRRLETTQWCLATHC
ncbi:hypothetical protein V5799_008303 [Amblyomma americanum]|uniref:Uncharacterized protein n=1 Tax=Amblyomma americanum TaxID=6943 RepID=A0AAQ4FDN5_AMBAM